MPSPLLSKFRPAVLASIPLILLSIHVFAKALFTLGQHRDQMDSDIRLLLAILRRHFYRDQSGEHQSLTHHLKAIITEKCRLRSRVGPGRPVTWGNTSRNISIIKELWTGRAIRRKYEERWGEVMKSRRDDYENWKKFGLWEENDEDDKPMYVKKRGGVPLMMVVSGTKKEVIDPTRVGALGSNEEDDMDEAEAESDDLSWRLSEGPLDPNHYQYLKMVTKYRMVPKDKTPSVEL